MKRFIIVAGLAAAMAGCGRSDRPHPPAVPQRIISVVPNATEMLFALGVGDRVIAVGDYDHFPPEVNSRPRVGGLLNPNIEKIIEMKPDLVITYGSQDVLRERLGEVGIRLYPFTDRSLDQTLDYMVDLGKTVGVGNRGEEIAARIRATFAELRKSAPAVRPTVLLVHDRGAGLLGSFYSVGNKAFQNDLIEIAGGRNVFGDINQEIVQPTLEEVIRRGPEVVIETISEPATDADIAQRLHDWETLQKLPAVLNHRVYVVAQNYMLVPGVRLDLAARKFAELIRQR